MLVVMHEHGDGFVNCTQYRCRQKTRRKWRKKIFFQLLSHVFTPHWFWLFIESLCIPLFLFMRLFKFEQRGWVMKRLCEPTNLEDMRVAMDSTQALNAFKVSFFNSVVPLVETILSILTAYILRASNQIHLIHSIKTSCPCRQSIERNPRSVFWELFSVRRPNYTASIAFNKQCS